MKKNLSTALYTITIYSIFEKKNVFALSSAISYDKISDAF